MSEEMTQVKTTEERKALAQSILGNVGELATFHPLSNDEFTFSVYHPYILIQDEMPAYRFISVPRSKTRLNFQPAAHKWYDDIAAEEFALTSVPAWVDSIPNHEFIAGFASNRFDNIVTAEFSIPAAVVAAMV